MIELKCGTMTFLPRDDRRMQQNEDDNNQNAKERQEASKITYKRQRDLKTEVVKRYSPLHCVRESWCFFFKDEPSKEYLLQVYILNGL